jgi:hypothetical protein
MIFIKQTLKVRERIDDRNIAVAVWLFKIGDNLGGLGGIKPLGIIFK